MPAPSRLLQGAPLICKPIGNPSLVRPQGTEIVGQPKTLKGRVLRKVSCSLFRSVSGSLQEYRQS